MPPAEPDAKREIVLDRPLDLRLTLRLFPPGTRARTSLRVSDGEAWRATRNPDGPATVRIVQQRDRVSVSAWGPGAGFEVETAPDLIGERDEREGFVAHHALVAKLDKQMRGMRFGRSGKIVESLVPTVFHQKVIGLEAGAGYSRMLTSHGERPPGPAPEWLLLPPSPETLAGMAYWAYHPFALERRRAETVITVAHRASWLEEGAAQGLEIAKARMASIRGVGPWSVAVVASGALGDADAVPVGDYHIPNTVAWALAGKPRGDDALMLQLLEPYRGHRGRVIRLITAGGITAPKYGPRTALRHLERS